MKFTKREKEILRQCWFFKEMEDQEIVTFLKQSNSYCKAYGKGEVIFYEGDIVNQIGIILSGSCAIVKLYPDGSEHLFQKLSVGYLTGVEIACTNKKFSPYSICCLEDVKLLTFSYQCLEQKGMIEESKRVWLQNRLLQFIASENIRKYYKINILSTRSLRERILLYLEIQQRKKATEQFEIPFDRNQFANYLCVNRSALSKELAHMKRDGILKYHKNKFQILGCELSRQNDEQH